MFTISEQEHRYQQIWEQYSPLFGSSIMEDDPEPLYNIGISLTQELSTELENLSKNLQNRTGTIGDWLSPDRLHITLDIPGRLGKHFQQEDVPKMVDWLASIAVKTKPFILQFGNINCFPHVLFREVYDEIGTLYELHNNISATIPWSEQPQFRGEKFVPHMSLVYLKQKTKPLTEGSINIQRILPRISMPVSQIYFQVSADGMKDNPIAVMELGTGKLIQALTPPTTWV